MARIRTIKPEFPQSESVGRLSRDGRLLFILLWTVADDAGRFRAASRMLASLLFPYDDDAPAMIGDWLDELEQAECIRRYRVEGSTYGEIVNWLKHQKIDRPSPSRLPAFVEESAIARETSRGIDADLGPRTKEQDQGIPPAAAPASVKPRQPEHRELNDTEQRIVDAILDAGRPLSVGGVIARRRNHNDPITGGADVVNLISAGHLMRCDQSGRASPEGRYVAPPSMIAA